jgi:hypothetical protein
MSDIGKHAFVARPTDPAKCIDCNQFESAGVHHQPIEPRVRDIPAAEFVPEGEKPTETTLHIGSQSSPVPSAVNIAEEAIRIVYGDREQTYDDPNRNFNKLAHMWTGHLLTKLKPGENITPQDVALMQVLLKVSREGFSPKRDNRVDMIGYTLCLDRIVEQNNDTPK